MCFRNVLERDMYRNNSEDKSNDKRNRGSEFVWFGGAQNARNRVILVEESSRTRRIRVGFDIQNAETYMTLGLIYSMEMSQGCMKNENNTRKEQWKEHRRLCCGS